MNPTKYFETLPWDSNFFQFPVARINNEDDIFLNEEILRNLFKNNIKLAYYSSPKELFISENKFYEMKLVDKKVTYLKEVLPHATNEKISFYDKEYTEQKLISLAHDSGIYSRFNVDNKIERKLFEDLYTHWIVNSVTKKIADAVLVSKEEKEITGFVTIGKKNDRADIGIIAVDSSHHGKGIGKALMFSAENFYAGKLKSIQVVTQGDNLPACKLYESCSYKLEKNEYFYHLWRKN
jgi:dTDP-4-amino-4,6-dideoxy-D-galactose acyltransferase